MSELERAVPVTARVVDVRGAGGEEPAGAAAVRRLTPAEVRAIARRVYAIMTVDLAVERERRGWRRR